MKHLYAFCLVTLLFLAGCEQEEVSRSCEVVNPVQELQWLKARVEELETSPYCQFVRQGKLNGHSVFVMGTCDPLINSVNAVFDCEGNLLCYDGDETCPNFGEEVTELKTIWSNQQ